MEKDTEQIGYIEFPEGIFGFEEEKRFIPIMAEEGSDAILYLQSVNHEELAFIVMNPFMLKEDYHPVLSREDYQKLGGSEEDLSYYCVCTIGNTAEESTVNLKCPIVVNAITRVARQVILDTDQYGFRHQLKEFKKEEA